MRRMLVIASSAAVLVVAIGGTSIAVGSDGDAAPGHVHAPSSGVEVTPELAAQLASAREATAQYALDLRAARKAGYVIITRMIPDMGFHYLNPTVTDFDVRRPPALVYLRRGSSWQLGALEWVFTETPETPPLEGATYGSFGAACHYRDGTFVFQPSEASCPAASPETGVPFRFWHPDLVTLHVWLWYPNPDGLYAGTNPLVAPFNE